MRTFGTHHHLNLLTHFFHNPWNKFPTILGISNKRYYYLPINQYDMKNGINCYWRLRLPTRRRHLDCSNRLPKTLAATLRDKFGRTDASAIN
jgi:hypothetical protein